METNNEIKDMPKNAPFEVPSDYFDSFEARLKQRMHDEQEAQQAEQPRTSIQFTRRHWAWVASAAAVVLVMAISLFVVMKQGEWQLNNQIQQLSAQNDYVDDLYDILDEEYIDDILADLE